MVATMIQSILTRERWPLLALIVSAAMLGAAHAFETFQNLYPCPLCLRQREVYWAALTVAGMGLALNSRWPTPRFLPALCAILGIVFLTGFGVAGYHAGVEWGIFPSFCPKAELDTTRSLLEQLEGRVPKGACDKAVWVFLGLSMAGWNAVISLVLSAASFVSASRTTQPSGSE